jgi:UDP-N-acetylmuramate: L-alanyl-gamma-D-glutamyl-meso-diaminopimelate ligase
MPSLLTVDRDTSVYILGICGTAMATLAGMLQARGCRVSGSDTGVYPPMSDFLARLNIPVKQGWNAANLEPRPDLVVVGNAIARGNAELEAVLDAGIPYFSMPEFLRLVFLPGKTPVVVAGTHGKTTTSALLAWCLTDLRADPSFLVGGIPLNFNASYAVGAGPHFVIEGDEYDTAYFDKGPKFLHYRPGVLVINGIEYDHADIYPDLETIVRQFELLARLVPRGGRVIYNGECPNARRAAARAVCPAETFGLAEGCDWRATGLDVSEGRTRFRVSLRGEALGWLDLGLGGEHNVRNALAAGAVLHHLGFDWEAIRAAQAGFLGVERRMTLRGEVGGVAIYDDFAHHPTAIRLTLAGARTLFPGRRIWAVFEPRSWTCRKKVHQQAMAECFDDADGIILAEVFRKEALPPEDRFQPEAAVAAMAARGRDAHFLPGAGEIVDFLAERLKPGDVVIIMSNGGFDDIHHKLLERIPPRHETNI